MSPKLFVFLLSVSAILVGALKLVPHQSGAHQAKAGPSVAIESLLSTLNEVRQAKLPNEPPLKKDHSLQEWAEEQIPKGLTHSPYLSAEQILSTLQTEVEGVAAASAGVFRAPISSEAFKAEFEAWVEVADRTYTHFALVLRPHEKKAYVDAWALLVQRLPKFKPELLAKGLQQFHHNCARCDSPYNGQFYGGDRILLLQCPHCQTNYDILAVDTEDKYARATTYLSQISPLAAFRKNISPYEEMISLWHGVLDHCQYKNDYEITDRSQAKDSWQTSAQTLERRSGDCEDTSILLADWLLSRGIETRVVIGETEKSEGHAWCLARIDGMVYLLETTGEKEDLPRDPPLATAVLNKYRPEYLFDRTHLYFFKGEKGQGPGDCWSEQRWEAVDYSADAPPPLVVGESSVSAPWFPSDPDSFVPVVGSLSKGVASSVSSEPGSD